MLRPQGRRQGPFELQIKPPEGVNMLRNATFSKSHHLLGGLDSRCKSFPSLRLRLDF